MPWWFAALVWASPVRSVPDGIVPHCLHGFDKLAYSDRSGEGVRLRPFQGAHVLRVLGLEGGDVVQSVNGHPLTSEEDLAAVHAAVGDERRCEYVVQRWGAPLTLAVQREAFASEAPPPVAGGQRAYSRVELAKALSNPERHGATRGGDAEKDALALLALGGRPVTADGVKVSFRREEPLLALWTAEASTWQIEVGDEVQTVTLVGYGPKVEVPPPTPPPWTRSDLPLALDTITDPPPFARVDGGVLLVERDAFRAWLEATEVRGLIHRGHDGGYDGYRLSKVRHSTPADRLGIKNGDVVHAIDDTVLDSLAKVQELLGRLDSVEGFEVRVGRRGEFLRVPVRVVDVLPE